MKSFKYTIKDELGIHARPAGLLVREAKSFKSVVSIKKGENQIDASQLFKLMGLNVKHGEEIEIIIEGEDEAEACEALEKFLNENL